MWPCKFTKGFCVSLQVTYIEEFLNVENKEEDNLNMVCFYVNIFLVKSKFGLVLLWHLFLQLLGDLIELDKRKILGVWKIREIWGTRDI